MSILFFEYMRSTKNKLNKIEENYIASWYFSRVWYLFNSRPRGYFDLKRNKDFLKFVWPDGKVDFWWYRITLPELWNFLVWYNGYYSWASKDEKTVYWV